ncbi:MAG TPA: xanthine dehydrogenase family protein molybdopterin-binding subunit [bacterium]|nr:xanthine dehydrogenase family protein molybdopterin-binding subunit [bacterium]
MSEQRPWIGRALRRREDRRFIRGEGQYVGDIVLPRMAHAVFVRSPHAHAALRHLDLSAARAIPGVLGVFASADLGGRLRPLPANVVEGATVVQVPHPPLAEGRVRYVGEPVALVVAETPEGAADAAERVAVEYDPLPAVVDPRAALASSVRLHDAAPDNVVLRWSRAGGDPAGAFAAAAHRVAQSFHIPRLAAAPIEGRGAVVAYDPGTDRLTVWCSMQDPHRPLQHLSRMLGRPEDRIRVIVPDVGGAFGSKGSLPVEIAVLADVAMRLRRPLRWVEGRRDNLLGSYQGRGLDADVALALDRDGRILAVRATLIADLGAYLLPPTPVPPLTSAMLLVGAYAIPHAAVEVVGVATNKVPTGPYRGAGRPEAAYLIERMVDLAARELGYDPVELRRRNVIPPERLPYRTPLGFTYDSGHYAAALDRACQVVDYTGQRAEQARAREAGRLRGIGVALYVERAGSQLWESASAAVAPSGRVTVRPGSNPHGQGHETTFAQIAADVLGVDPDAVTVEHGDSAVVPRGVGTFGSRSTTVGGSAVVVALEQIRAKAAAIAAHLLEASPGDLEWGGGHFHVRGAPQRRVSFAEVAAAAYQPGRLPAGLEMGLQAAAVFTLPGPVFPYGAYAAVVEIDPETGRVDVVRLVAVDDAGRIVNPLLAEGQVIGAVVQGLGQSLSEAVVYGEDGQMLTASFTEYALPRAADAPPLHSEFQETPSPLNPLGAKGIGEAGTIAAPAAIANAVLDALAPLGVRHLDFPFTPPRIWKVISQP